MKSFKEMTFKEKVLNIIYILLFIACTVAMITAMAYERQDIGILFFGLLFYLAGLFALYGRETIVIAHYLVGLCCMLGSIIYMNYDKLKIIATDFSSNQLLSIKITIGLLLISFIFLLLHFLRKKTNIYYWIFLLLNSIFLVLSIKFCIQ